MAQRLRNFWLEAEGQDLTEYALLLTFIALMCLAFVYSGAASVHGIWTRESNDLVSANSIAGGG